MRAFRQLRKATDDRVGVQDILDSWKSERPSYKNFCGQLKEVLKYRHWLAHGRYWVPKFPKFDFDTIYSLVETTNDELLAEES